MGVFGFYFLGRFSPPTGVGLISESLLDQPRGKGILFWWGYLGVLVSAAGGGGAVIWDCAQPGRFAGIRGRLLTCLQADFAVGGK